MPNPTQEAAHILVARRNDGIQGDLLPKRCRPTDIQSALAIQDAVTTIWCDSLDDSVGAWKCGLPSPEKIVVAPIFTSTINTIPPVALLPSHQKARVEPELAFFFGRDLPCRDEPYTTTEVDAAILRTHLALELINSRYTNPTDCKFPDMLADGLVNQGLFIGPEVDGELAKQANEFEISVAYGNQPSDVHQGKHPSGNPRAPIYWLVEFLRSQGKGIIAGQAVITGSFAGVIEVPLNTFIDIHYAGLGTLNASFIEKY